ncbi:hypothetical protein [Reyranella sp.]|uniref:hypothetical protein n=1 Tax=Reyranella sp. TaxID=1929291 RepID=UPI003D14B5F7
MLTTTTGPWTFTASGASGSFVVNAPVYDAAALALYAFDPATGATYHPAAVVTLAADLSGATVTVAAGLTSGHTVVVHRVPMQTQPQRLNPSGPFPAPSVERQLDRAFADIQALRAMVERSLRIAQADAAVEELGVALLRANKVAGFDADGLPALLSNVPTGAVAIAAYMQTALGKSSAAALLTYFGISAYVQTLLSLTDVAALQAALGIDYATAAEVQAAVSSVKTVTPASLLGLWQSGSALSSAATLDLTAGTDGYQRTISDAATAIATVQGTQPLVRLTAGANGVTFTHHASNLISRTASDIVMRSGDSVTLLRIGTNQWREIGFDAVPSWKTGNLSVANGTILSPVSHYLGKRVGAIRLMGACTDDDANYTPSMFSGGKRIEFERGVQQNLGWASIVSDTTVTVQIAVDGLGIVYGSAGDGTAAIDPSKWNLWLEIDAR